MADNKNTKPAWEQPVPTNGTPDELADYWTEIVNHYGATGTEGRYAVKQLAAAHAAQDAAAGPHGFGPGEAAADAAAAKANAPKKPAPTALTKPTGPTGKTGATGSIKPTGAVKPTGAKKSSTTPTTPTTKTTVIGNNVYSTDKNGILSYNGTPYTGEYNSKYYNQGKLETPEQVKADFLANYGVQARFIASVPELSDKLNQAIAQNWSVSRWQAEFANTTWAQTHPGDIGLAEIKRISSPSEYNTEYNAAQLRASQLAANLGIQLTPQQLGKQIDPNSADFQLASASNVDQTAINNGQDIVNWILQNPNATDAQIQQRMAKYGTIDPVKGPGGAIFAQAKQLQSLAEQYGTIGTNPQSVINDYALKIAQGLPGYDQNTFEEQQKQSAMNIYKPFAKQISDGATVQSLASPYLTTMAGLLEIDPSSIEIGSSTGLGNIVTKAMMGDGTTAVDPISFANTVRSQPQWQYTNNAKQTMLQNVDSLVSNLQLKGY